MIDWSQVMELRDQIGADEMDEVIDMFIEEVEEKIARLRAGPDVCHLEEDLHFLKGSALNLGFATFAQLCQQGETMAGTGQSDQIDVAELLDSYDASKAVFMADKGERLAP